jgi:hypothetical protein
MALGVERDEMKKEIIGAMHRAAADTDDAALASEREKRMAVEVRLETQRFFAAPLLPHSA